MRPHEAPGFLLLGGIVKAKRKRPRREKPDRLAKLEELVRSVVAELNPHPPRHPVENTFAAIETESIQHTLFDTFLILPGLQSHLSAPDVIHLLQVPIGCQGKTEADTNMDCAGMFPAGNSFRLHRTDLKTGYQPFVLDFLNAPSRDDRDQFLRCYTFELVRNNRREFSCLASDLVPETSRFDFGSLLFIGDGSHFRATFRRQHPFALDPYGKGIRARLAMPGVLTRHIR
jgi:hypothetical protein